MVANVDGEGTVSPDRKRDGKASIVEGKGRCGLQHKDTWSGGSTKDGGYLHLH
jgi:hypothetical protein